VPNRTAEYSSSHPEDHFKTALNTIVETARLTGQSKCPYTISVRHDYFIEWRIRCYFDPTTSRTTVREFQCGIALILALRRWKRRTGVRWVHFATRIGWNGVLYAIGIESE